MIARLGRGAIAIALALSLGAACGSALGSPTQLLPRTVTGSLGNGDVSLSYLLERPAGPGPFPAVVVGHGSGEVRKEASQFISTNMLARGFMVYRYDKRGVGESTGTYSNVGITNSERMFADLSSDMAAGAEFLRLQPDVDRTRIGLIGASQAGWIIPLAARRTHPAFMILIVGPTVTVGQEIYYSRFAEETTTPFDELSKILKEYQGAHGYDPRPVLEELTTPGLWLLGGVDRSIPTIETVQILDQLIGSGKPYTRVIYPFSGHSLNGANMWPDIDAFLKNMKIMK
jgi:dienelactone hydrolase